MTKRKILGWSGRVLKVDLTKLSTEVMPLDLEVARTYLGARGINSRGLYNLANTDLDEFSPDNPVLFGVGPLCGTLVPASSRFTVTSKSPLTNIFADSCAGGYFGPELKYAGYDQIILIGASEKPVYLLIDDDDIEIRSADSLWGNDTWTTQKEIKRQHGDDFQIACIGQAGENLVRYAGIIHGLKRAAGKFGMGAVMGSKKLKAIAVRGTKGVGIAYPQLLKEYALEIIKKITTSPLYRLRSIYGTAYLEDALSPLGVMTTRNFQSTSFEHYKDIGGIRLVEKYTKKTRSCMACPAHCTHYYSLQEGRYKGTYGEGPEFTCTGMIGDRCGISDLEALLKINQLTNGYGMDQAAFGGIIGWAMDCFERGILNKTDTNGLELRWGNAEAVIELVHKTARREGFGNVLAEGEKRAPQIVGRGSDRYMYHIKGGTIVIEEPRALPGFCLGYITSTRGSDHLRASFTLETNPDGPKLAEKLFGSQDAANPKTPKGKGKGVKWFEDLMAVVDALGLCKFNYPRFMDVTSAPDILAKLFWIVTGIEVSGEKILRIGERIFNLEKAFNVRLGLTRKDDNFSVPEKFLEEPLKDGPFKGQIFHLDEMLDEYYEARGWGKDGLQTRKKLEELELREIADELMAQTKLSAF